MSRKCPICRAFRPKASGQTKGFAAAECLMMMGAFGLFLSVLPFLHTPHKQDYSDVKVEVERELTEAEKIISTFENDLILKIFLPLTGAISILAVVLYCFVTTQSKWGCRFVLCVLLLLYAALGSCIVYIFVWSSKHFDPHKSSDRLSAKQLKAVKDYLHPALGVYTALFLILGPMALVLLFQAMRRLDEEVPPGAFEEDPYEYGRISEGTLTMSPIEPTSLGGSAHSQDPPFQGQTEEKPKT